ncbi:hypothetical protein EWB00_010084 [Schistosoma japonicum]|uniref:Uncharacterized protein n=1 Tax=Schistosoma japonicum TaxID=6182 RepID=A0A4Z2DPZ2_SCHJA|nr:hypothetical protein EWB00_010084 [Schistosoma japonicum]
MLLIVVYLMHRIAFNRKQSSVLHFNRHIVLFLSLFMCIPLHVSLNKFSLDKQISLQHHSEEQQQLSIDHILSKVKDAEQFNALNNHKMKTEPDELIIAPVRFNRLRRYFRHQKRMMRAQYRMMRLQRRLYRRHYRRPYGYGYFP